jgi:hypothetical protein
MTIKALYPNVRPTLNLNFARTKALDPRVTFTRASTATFVGSNGLIQTAASGAARFDHNPATGESLGLLVEQARTNNALYSSDLSTIWWTSFSNHTRTDNAIAAPDGTISATLITANDTGSNRVFGRTTAPAFTVISLFAKENTSNLLVTNTSGGGYPTTFNLNTGVSTSSAGYSSFMVPYPNGWYRCVEVGPSSTVARWALGVSSTIGDSIYIWGAQLEAGAFPTSYIPTTTATVTRAADVASITGSNFSSWYNQSAGSWFVNHDGGNTFALTVGTDANNRYYLSENSAAGSGYLMKTLGVNQFSFSTGIFTKGAISYGANYANIATSGTLQTAATSVSPPVSNSLKIGMGINNDFQGTGTISHLTYYPVRLPDAQLQALTAT